MQNWSACLLGGCHASAGSIPGGDLTFLILYC